MSTSDNPPTPLIGGTFAVYPHEGTFVLVTDIPGRGVEHTIIPPMLMKVIPQRALDRLLGGAPDAGSME